MKKVSHSRKTAAKMAKKAMRKTSGTTSKVHVSSLEKRRVIYDSPLVPRHLSEKDLAEMVATVAD